MGDGKKLSRLAVVPIVLAILGLGGIGLAACSKSSGPSATPTGAGGVLGATAAPSTATQGATPTAPAGDVAAFSVHSLVVQLAPSVVRVQTEEASLSGGAGNVGVGSGVILDTQGHIVTNNHVVTLGTTQPASKILVTINASKTVPATIVGRDPATDLAVIKVDPSGLSLQPAKLGGVAQTQVGDTVVAIGYAFALPGEATVTRGVLSAKGRSIQETQSTISPALQTDASINPGNSGGPLANLAGDVIGINTAGIQSAQNIGFAISADLVQSITAELIKSGDITRGYLGISAVDITPALASAYNLPVEEGVGIASVASGSPAANAGLQAQDIIVAIDGQTVTNSGDLLNALRLHGPGSTVTITYYRGNQKQTAQVTVGSTPGG